MPIIGLLFILLSSVLAGALITGLLRERDSNFVICFATGFLSLFVLLLGCTLAALKTDMSLHHFSLLYIGLVSVMSVAGLFFTVRREWRKNDCIFSKIESGIIVLALFTGVISFVVLSQSYINDDILEIVTTSINTDTYYEYAALTGERMINGLPIFNKVYVMPMFDTIMCKIFGITPSLFANIVIPVIVYAANLLLVNLLAVELKIPCRGGFFISYILWLISGTYLPAFGVPVTLGYAILRNGYSGYAVLYGILIPLFLLWLAKKKYIMAVLTLVPGVSLVRIDRVFYAFFDFADSYSLINQAGKQMALFMVSVMAAWALYKVKNIKPPVTLIIVPGLFVSYVVASLISFFEKKKEKMICLSAIAIIFLASVNFSPYKGSKVQIKEAEKRKEVAECLSFLTAEYGDIKIYSDEEFMSLVRVCNGNVEVLYGRDFDSTYMMGLDYEIKSENVRDFSRDMKNQLNGFDYLVTEKNRVEILKAAASEGTDAVVLLQTVNLDDIQNDYEEAGFSYLGTHGKYNVFVLK